MAPPVQYVSPSEIRHRFNEGRYFERLQEGEFVAEVTIVRPAPTRFARGTTSQMVAYRDHAGRTVAIVHQYGDAHGNPARGTLPDPKYLFDGATRYKVSRISG